VESEFSTLFLCPERAEMSRSAILAFAKPAEPGCVKTRLLGVLSAQLAASVHHACLEDTVRQVSRFPGCEPCLHVVGPPHMARELAVALRLDSRWRVDVQRGRDLSERLQGRLPRRSARPAARLWRSARIRREWVTGGFFRRSGCSTRPTWCSGLAPTADTTWPARAG
jgi:hypothetical protein